MIRDNAHMSLAVWILVAASHVRWKVIGLHCERALCVTNRQGGVKSVCLITMCQDTWWHSFCITYSFIFHWGIIGMFWPSFLFAQRQAEDKQRGVCEPRDPVAAAVPEERYQQVSCIKSDWFWFWNVCLLQCMVLLSPCNGSLICCTIKSLPLYRNLKWGMQEHKCAFGYLSMDHCESDSS